MKAYGAEAYPGIEVIGGAARPISLGGTGRYSGLVTRDYCDEGVNSVSGFLSAIQKPGRRIWLERMIDLTSYLEIQMADSILLASNLSGGVYNHNMGARYVPLLWSGAKCLFLGITVEGPSPNIGSSNAPPYSDGIGVANPGVIVESCEIRNWQYGGVKTLSDTRVLFNYIHHCQHAGIGYGVSVGGSNSKALVMGNYLDYCRHFVMGECGLTSYELIYNIFGPHCTNTQIDCHGGHDDKCGANIYGTPAGRKLLVHYNTSLCTNQRMMGVRGIPAESCEAHHNRSYYTSGSPCSGLNCPRGWEVYAQELGGPDDYGAKQPYIRMAQHDNWFGSTPPPDIPEPPGPSTTGDLSVKTVPAGAAILIDGQTVGITQPGADLVVEVIAGSHTIGFGDLAGYNTPADQTVTVPVDTVVYITATYTPSSVVSAGAPAIVAFTVAVGMILIGKQMK